jgi:twitching motility protein PilT
MLSISLVNELLMEATAMRCTDVHLQPGSPPLYRLSGALEAHGSVPLAIEDTLGLLKNILRPQQWELFEKKGDYDFAYMIDEDHRYRVNAYRTLHGISIAFRILHSDILDFEALRLPPVIRELSERTRGLILVTGVTGSGKTTTLATMIKHINGLRPWHIVTIEDPVEIIHQNDRSLVSQREIGHHCSSFLEGLKYALRQDPDAILIGELRDQDTIRTAVSAAETGHLVMSTVHSSEAPITIDRILSFFSGAEQEQVRQQLAVNLQGVISQRLLPMQSGEGLVPALEILVSTSTVRKFILQNRVTDLKTVMQNRDGGMQTFNDALFDLVSTQMISESTAMEASDNPAVLRRLLAGGVSGGDKNVILG